MDRFWRVARDELRSGHRVYILIVAAAKKGSPGTSAARMLIYENGQQYGTIGGGIMERQAFDLALSSLNAGKKLLPELVTLKHNQTVPEESSGLICGGQQNNIRFTLDGESLGLVEDLALAEEAEHEALLSVSCEGLRLDPGAACFRSELVDHDGWLYRYNFVNQRRVAIFGGGHCGVELAILMHRLGYAVTVIDPREELFTMEKLPPEVAKVQLAFEDSGAKVAYPEKTLAVVMTYSMPTDLLALSSVLEHPFRFVGLMGSKVKIARIKGSLLEMGLSDLQVERVRAPVGLDFNSDTPEEIAVSIAAQILLERESR
ncbi:MAG: XdhC family protein [Verrucomicrobiota bacterium]